VSAWWSRTTTTLANTRSRGLSLGELLGAKKMFARINISDLTLDTLSSQVEHCTATPGAGTHLEQPMQSTTAGAQQLQSPAAPHLVETSKECKSRHEFDPIHMARNHIYNQGPSTSQLTVQHDSAPLYPTPGTIFLAIAGESRLLEC